MSGRYVLSRLATVLPVLLFVSIAVFAFSHLLPGDSVLAILGENADQHSIDVARRELGLDRALPIQYLSWIGEVLRGHLGVSLITHQSVSDVLKQRFPVTLQLAVLSFVISVVIALPAGVISAYRRGSFFDRIVTTIALAGVAMPSFWLGILFVILFSVKLGWLPPSGFVSLTEDPIRGLRYLLLPSLALGSAHAAILTRQIRSGLLEVLHQDYVRTARAKGLGEIRVIFRHALPNALLPVLTVAGLQIGRILGGSVIIETVFAMPGLGRYSVSAIFSHDYAIVQATILLAALIVVVANLLTDLLYVVLDPRIKLG